MVPSASIILAGSVLYWDRRHTRSRIRQRGHERHQFAWLKRLGNAPIHAGIGAPLTNAAERMSRQGNDRRESARQRFLVTNVSGGLETIHLWHFEVHQDGVEFVALPCLHCLPPRA